MHIVARAQADPMALRYDYYANIVSAVDGAVDAIAALPRVRCYDTRYLQEELIPALGLNNEYPEEQPRELSPVLGTGLHLWQYPNQLARYLVWLSYNARSIRSYMEIGCRWGGTFILVCEWLRKIGAPLEFVIAVDPIEITPFLDRYTELAPFPVIYKQTRSTSPDFRAFVAGVKPAMTFIDGDHNMAGVMSDHLLVRKFAEIIVHHDVCSQACPASTLFWNYLKSAEDRFDAFEFTDQYASVSGSFLGIGALKRKV